MCAVSRHPVSEKSKSKIPTGTKNFLRQQEVVYVSTMSLIIFSVQVASSAMLSPGYARVKSENELE